MSVWDHLVGQDETLGEFQRAAHAALLSPPGAEMTHAWLVTGPPGSGRSVAAEAFAAALVCPQGGCGVCPSCQDALSHRHPDIEIVAPEGVAYKTADARALVSRASVAPMQSRWHVLVVEDADRLTETANNVLLKAIEEPSDSIVWILCTPSAEDVLPTVRSRCRHVRLRTPDAQSVATFLAESEGLDPATAMFASQAAQGHVGRARALAIDGEVRERRNAVLRVPSQLGDLGSCLKAAAKLVAMAKDDAESFSRSVDDVEREALMTAWGEGAEGRGVKGGARGIKGALKELEDRQKSRRNRMQRDELDRALLDLLGYYRDVIKVQFVILAGESVQGLELINSEHRLEIEKAASSSNVSETLARIESIERARQSLIANVTPLLAMEVLAIELRSPGLRKSSMGPSAAKMTAS